MKSYCKQLVHDIPCGLAALALHGKPTVYAHKLVQCRYRGIKYYKKDILMAKWITEGSCAPHGSVRADDVWMTNVCRFDIIDKGCMENVCQ